MRSIRPFLVAGAFGGLCGGVVAAVFQWLVTEDQIRAALELEQARAHAAGEEHDALFGRTAQLLGGMLATTIYGVVVGIVFGVLLARLWHVLGGTTILQRAAALAVCAYVAWSLVPMLKYPPNPPGVGDPETVGTRTIEFLTFLGASVVLMVLAWALWGWVGSRGLGGAVRAAITVGSYGVALGACAIVWPESASAGSTPADLIWHFRLASILQTALLWIVATLVAAIVLERCDWRDQASATAGDSAADRWG